MMNRQALLGFLLGLLVVGALWLWVQSSVLLPDSQPAPDLPSTRTEQGAAPDSREPAPGFEALRGVSEPSEDRSPPSVPELFADRPRRTDESATGLRVPVPGGESERELLDIQRELLSLSRQGMAADPAELTQVLGRLRATLGTDEVAGVNLRDLESTVDLAGQMRGRAQELGRLAEQSDSEDHTERMMELVDEIHDLQSIMPHLGDLNVPGVPEEDGP